MVPSNETEYHKLKQCWLILAIPSNASPHRVYITQGQLLEGLYLDMKMCWHVMSFLNTKMSPNVGICSRGKHSWTFYDRNMAHSQYRGCWWSGDSRNNISGHDIGLFGLEQSGPLMERFNFQCVLKTVGSFTPVASFTKEVNPRLAKRPLKINGRLANRVLTSLVQ